MENLKTAFAYHRAFKLRAHRAIELAREDVANGTARYPGSEIWPAVTWHDNGDANGNRMCIEVIQNLKEEFNLPIEVCDVCSGDGEYRIFCGHYATVNCEKCKGKGYLHVSKMCEKSKKIRA